MPSRGSRVLGEVNERCHRAAVCLERDDEEECVALSCALGAQRLWLVAYCFIHDPRLASGMLLRCLLHQLWWERDAGAAARASYPS